MKRHSILALAFLTILIAYLPAALSCGKQSPVPDYEPANGQPAEIQNRPSSVWVDYESGKTESGFTVYTAKIEYGADAALKIEVTNSGETAAVSLYSESPEFEKAYARIVPPSGYVFSGGEWAAEIESSHALHMSAEFYDSVDAGIAAAGGGAIEMMPGRPLFTAIFVNKPDAPALRETSRAPRGDQNRVSPVRIKSLKSGDTEIRWLERNAGDYDNDGEVGIPDLTPIALYYLQTEGEIMARVDGNGDGEIGIPDITPLAQNYASRVSGYNVYRYEETGGAFINAGKLPNKTNPVSLSSIDRPPQPFAGVFADYVYTDVNPPEGIRYVYGVRAFDGSFEEGTRSFPLADYLFELEAEANWAIEQTMTGAFGHSITIPAGTLPAGATLEVREVAEAELPAPYPGDSDFISGIEFIVKDSGGQEIHVTGNFEITIPIPLNVSSISPVSGSAGFKAASAVDAPDFLPLYSLEGAGGPYAEVTASALVNDATAYRAVIDSTGTFCLFGRVTRDTEPPVWSGPAGAQSVEVTGDNLVEVSFGTALDASGPVAYNVYFSTSSPVDPDTAQFVGGVMSSPAEINAVRGAAQYHFIVRAQDRMGNEEENTNEVSVFVPRPNDSLFLSTDKAEYEVGDTIFFTANVKAIKSRLFQLNSVRVTFTPLIEPAAGQITLGSFFDYHDGIFFPAFIVPVEGNPSFIEFNASFAQASKQAQAGASGDLFEFPFTALKPGFVQFGLMKDPAAPATPYSFYTSLGDNTPIPFTWHQGCTAKIVPKGTLTGTPGA